MQIGIAKVRVDPQRHLKPSSSAALAGRAATELARGTRPASRAAVPWLRAARVISVSAGAAHGPFKPAREAIDLVAGLGVAGDAHFGRTVQHRSRARGHPDWENLRQVHLLGVELHEELARRAMRVAPGEMGENILTAGIDLLRLPLGTELRLGSTAIVELTGLRNPCSQLDGVRPGLMNAVLDRASDGALIRRAGVMAVVRVGGTVATGDPITEERLPVEPLPLRPV